LINRSGRPVCPVRILKLVFDPSQLMSYIPAALCSVLMLVSILRSLSVFRVRNDRANLAPRRWSWFNRYRRFGGIKFFIACKRRSASRRRRDRSSIASRNPSR
jgi:hypothetical protein